MSVKMYEIIKIFSNKISMQKLNGVLLSDPALVWDESTCTFPQNIDIIKSRNR
jgi:hypothetical protein